MRAASVHSIDRQALRDVALEELTKLGSLVEPALADARVRSRPILGIPVADHHFAVVAHVSAGLSRLGNDGNSSPEVTEAAASLAELLIAIRRLARFNAVDEYRYAALRACIESLRSVLLVWRVALVA